MLSKINIQDIVTISKEAGNAIMQIYNQDFEVEYKEDSSPFPPCKNSIQGLENFFPCLFSHLYSYHFHQVSLRRLTHFLGYFA